MNSPRISMSSAAPLLGNPFRGSVQGDAWNNADGASDVPGIHKSVFDTCCAAVDAVRLGQCSAGIVIHGEAGSGKTHLIGRLRRQFTDRLFDHTRERISQAFAYIQLSTNAACLARHTRRCIAVDLLRSFGKGPSQLERMVITRLMDVAEGGGHLETWWDFLLEERSGELESLLIDLGLKENLSPAFTTILGHVIRRQHRLEVAGWLRGDALTDTAYERLGVAPTHPDDDPEQVSRQVLIDVMRLAGPEIPLVLCFDQVEALQITPDDPFPLFAFSQLIVDLHGADQNLVLISCMQTEFATHLINSIPEYGKARLQGYASCSLKPLDFDQARQVLAVRVALASGKTADQTVDIAPLSDDNVRGFLGKYGHCYPRALLDRAARWFDGPQPPSRPVSELLTDEWERRSERAQQASNSGQTDAILRHGLPLLVNVVDPAWKSAASKQGVALDYVLTGPQLEARVGVKLLEGTDGRTLWKPLQTLDNLYPEKLQPRLEKLVILRDERTPINKTAVKTRQLLDSLEKKDAHFYRIPPEALAALDALRGLMADAQAGDLDFDGTTVPPATVLEWLRAHLPGSLKELADLCLMPHSIDPSPSLIDRLQEVLVDRSLAAASDLAVQLGVEEAALIQAAQDRPDLCGVIGGNVTAIFSARFGNGCEMTSSSESKESLWR